MGGNIAIILTSRDYIPFDKCLTRSEVSQCFQVKVENILGFVSSLADIALVKYCEKHCLRTIQRKCRLLTGVWTWCQTCKSNLYLYYCNDLVAVCLWVGAYEYCSSSGVKFNFFLRHNRWSVTSVTLKCHFSDTSVQFHLLKLYYTNFTNLYKYLTPYLKQLNFFFFFWWWWWCLFFFCYLFGLRLFRLYQWK